MKWIAVGIGAELQIVLPWYRFCRWLILHPTKVAMPFPICCLVRVISGNLTSHPTCPVYIYLRTSYSREMPCECGIARALSVINRAGFSNFLPISEAQITRTGIGTVELNDHIKDYL